MPSRYHTLNAENGRTRRQINEERAELTATQKRREVTRLFVDVVARQWKGRVLYYAVIQCNTVRSPSVGRGGTNQYTVSCGVDEDQR